MCSDVGEGETGKKARTTLDAGGKSVSEKSQDTRTSKNPFEQVSHTAYSSCLCSEGSNKQPERN